MHRVFVYGTLKRGFENHHLLERAVFLGAAHTCQAYAMLDGPFPVLRDNGDARHQVAGELYEVDDATLAALDDLEDTGSGIYDRIETDIILMPRSGETQRAVSKAYMYVGCAAYWDYRPASFYAKLDERGRLDWQPGGPHRNQAL